MECLRREGTVLQQCPFLHPVVLQNVIVFGGTSSMKGFLPRFAKDLAAMAMLPPGETEVGEGDQVAAATTIVRPSTEACIWQVIPQSSVKVGAGGGAGMTTEEVLEPLVGGIRLMKQRKLLQMLQCRCSITRAEALDGPAGVEKFRRCSELLL